MIQPLSPAMTLSDILGPGHVHVPRPHDRASRWFPGGTANLDSFTGTSLSFCGDTPVICSSGFTTKAALDLMEAAGIACASKRIEYRADGHEAAIAMAGREARLVFSHAYPADAPEMAQSWIDPPLLAYLNNKANLTELVPSGDCPERRMMAWSEFTRTPSPMPVVLKVVTDQSTGSGGAVILYRDPADLPAAMIKFEGVEHVVVEELLDIVDNPCLNFAIDQAGVVHFLGGAEQIVGKAGNYIGNWFDLDHVWPEDIVAPARAVVERASALGYRGIAGIDMARLRDGRALVLDLNFRINSSTPALLLAPALRERGVRYMRLATGRHPGPAGDAARRLMPYAASGEVIPLRLFDPVAAGYGPGDASAHCLVTGSSRDDLDRNWSNLAQILTLPEI